MGSLDDNISQATDLLNKHDIEGAIQMYQEVLKLDPDDPTALTGLGAAFDEAGELENAVDCYKKALKFDPDNAVSYTHLRAHETRHDLVCRLLLEKKKKKDKSKKKKKKRENAKKKKKKQQTTK